MKVAGYIRVMVVKGILKNFNSKEIKEILDFPISEIPNYFNYQRSMIK